MNNKKTIKKDIIDVKTAKNQLGFKLSIVSI